MTIFSAFHSIIFAIVKNIRCLAILLLKLGGTDIHAIWKGVSGKARVHGGGGASPTRPPPLEIGKKDCQSRQALL